MNKDYQAYIVTIDLQTPDFCVHNHMYVTHPSNIGQGDPWRRN